MKQKPIGKVILDEVVPGQKRRNKDWFSTRLYEELEKVQDDTPDYDAICGVSPGNLYFYSYDAKYAKKLPYWDTRPLTYIIELTGDGFYGYNLHYVNPEFRKVIAKSLKKNSVAFAPRECFHQYLCAGLTSSPMKVPKDSWESVAVLPTENFVDKFNQPVASSRVWSI
jgi:hypothetical protein